MAKKQSSKTTGGTQKFGKKAAPKTYDADKKKIEAFCKRRENHDAGLPAPAPHVQVQGDTPAAQTNG